MNEITYTPGNATRGLTFLMVPAVEVTEKQQQHDANWEERKKKMEEMQEGEWVHDKK